MADKQEKERLAVGYGRTGKPSALRRNHGWRDTECSCPEITDMNILCCDICNILRYQGDASLNPELKLGVEEVGEEGITFIDSIFECNPEEKVQLMSDLEECKCDAVMKFEGTCFGCVPMNTGPPVMLKDTNCRCLLDSAELNGKCDFCLSL